MQGTNTTKEIARFFKVRAGQVAGRDNTEVTRWDFSLLFLFPHMEVISIDFPVPLDQNPP